MSSYRTTAFTGPVPPEHADTILELAYLVAAADGRLDDVELDAYRDVVVSVREVPAVAQPDFDRLLDRFAANVDHKEIGDRVRELAPKLPMPLREVVFKLAVQLSLADLDASREEDAIKDVMIEALGLTADRADALTAEVYAAAGGGEE